MLPTNQGVRSFRRALVPCCDYSPYRIEVTMGKSARLRRERREQLPDSWESHRYGTVFRTNFNGCEVIAWDFTHDEPISLFDHSLKQVHLNKNYAPDGTTSEDVASWIRSEVPGADVQPEPDTYF